MLLALFLTSISVFAALPEMHYARDLARAHSHAEIARLERDFTQLKVAQAACHIQLAEKIAPVSCYEAVALEGGEPRARIRKLDRLCATAAANLRFADESEYVSPSCRKHLRAALAIRAYRDEEGAEWSSY